jgi:hypothetical protein
LLGSTATPVPHDNYVKLTTNLLCRRDSVENSWSDTSVVVLRYDKNTH